MISSLVIGSGKEGENCVRFSTTNIKLVKLQIEHSRRIMYEQIHKYHTIFTYLLFSWFCKGNAKQNHKSKINYKQYDIIFVTASENESIINENRSMVPLVLDMPIQIKACQ